MKTIYKFFIAFTLLNVFSCSGFLDQEPLGKPTEETFFKTEEHAILATNAVYNLLRQWPVHTFAYVGMTDIASDDAEKGSEPNDAYFLEEINLFTHDASNIAPLTVWGGYYKTIARANIAISRIPGIDMDATKRNRLVAESRFIRGLCYFNLVRWFGDVPLITTILTPNDNKLPRTPQAQVYTQIIEDFQFAVANLPEKSNYTQTDMGRATKGAARGYLARVYMHQGNWAETEKLCLDIINSNQYSLLPDYSKIFLPEGENSAESVFELQVEAFANSEGNETGGGSQWNEIQGVRGTPNLGWGFNRPSDDLIKEYEKGDPRREATILYPGEELPDGSAIVEDNPNIVNERYNQKAWQPLPPGGNGNGSSNIRLLRYADVLLMAAEALNENGKPTDALKYLNQVRERARSGISGILPNVTTTDKTNLRLAIWHERRVELAMEQQRWWDLLRTGRLAERMTATGKTNFKAGKNELFPIPQREITITGGSITQNPGYN